MAQQTILELAKQGNPKAIAALINRALQSKGIIAKANREENCLQILLESEQVPNQSELLPVLTRGIISLQIDGVQTLKIFGKQQGGKFPAWVQEVPLQNSSPEPSLVASPIADPVVRESPVPTKSKDVIVSPKKQPVSIRSSTSTQKTQTTKIKEYKPSGPQTRPRLRWAARYFDLFLFSILSVSILALVFPSSLSSLESSSDLPSKTPDQILGFLLLLAYVFVEPIMLCSWGTTPGKAILKIRLRQRNGAKLSYLQALNRSFLVWIHGFGLGLIPLITLFTLSSSYRHLSKHGITKWDDQCNLSVSHQTIGPFRAIVITLSLLLFLGLGILEVHNLIK